MSINKIDRKVLTAGLHYPCRKLLGLVHETIGLDKDNVGML